MGAGVPRITSQSRLCPARSDLLPLVPRWWGRGVPRIGPQSRWCPARSDLVPLVPVPRVPEGLKKLWFGKVRKVEKRIDKFVYRSFSFGGDLHSKTTLDSSLGLLF